MLNLRIQRTEVPKLSPKITVVGVGGAGGNAVNNMISSGLEGCDFVVCNTDAQALDHSLCESKIQLGNVVTGGLGAGAKPEIGEKAAIESLDDVLQYLEGANMAFVTAGMGGGTGTGAAPVIAKACRDAGILTVGVVTKPFHFEGSHRMRLAEAGIAEMQQYVDTLIVIPNQNLFRVANEKTTFAEAFRMADSVLQSGVRGVTDLMMMPGLINLDFADIRSAMLEMGKAMMGTGEAEGDRRALEAAEAAINNPLLDDVSMKGAKGVIINVTGGSDMTLFEVDEACNRIRDEVDPNANIIFGSTFDDKLEGRMRVSIVATGIDAGEAKATTRTTGGVKVTAVARQPQAAPVAAPVHQPVMQANAIHAATQAARQAIPTRPTYTPLVGNTPAPAPMKPMEEPEADLFEQNEFVASAHHAPMANAVAAAGSSLRGTTYQGSFIPPQPVQPARAEMQVSAGGYASSYGQAPAQVGYNLRPPVPGQNAAERKKTPSLFERITSAVVNRHHEEDDLAGDEESAQGTAAAGSMRATPRLAEAPSQGRLNIDAPAAARPAAEDELDIPAFLRRQAN